MNVQFPVAAVILLWALPAISHTGHAEAPGADAVSGAAGGPIEVSETARRNLGLQIGEVELRPIETTLRVIGEITAEPDLSATVSSRIAGRVTRVFAKEGERVRRGERLVEIESLQLGDPPPRVRYPTPIDGIVIDRHVVAGDDVEPRGHLFEIADLQELLAIGHVFEGQIGQVEVGQAVRVRVPSFPDETFEGVVERLGGKLDQASRSLAIYVRVKNPDERLRPHMRATLSLVTGRADLALAVPKSAVLGDAGALFVFVQSDDTPDLFDRRPVVVGVSNDRYIEVIDGVAPGERVVTEGNYSLQFLPPVASLAAEAHGEPDEIAASEARGTWLLWVVGAGALAAALALAVFAFRLRARAARQAY